MLPAPDSSSHIQFGVNEAGEITGYYNASNGQVHGFLRADDGTMIIFDARDATGKVGNTFPTSINSKGEITGYATFSIGVTRVFLRDKHGKITTFEVSSNGTYPSSINENGEVTGDYFDSNFILRGFLRKSDHHEDSDDDRNGDGGKDGERPN
jgi:hypothetical protein